MNLLILTSFWRNSARRGAQFVPIGMPTTCWSSVPPKETNMLSMRNSSILITCSSDYFGSQLICYLIASVLLAILKKGHIAWEINQAKSGKIKWFTTTTHWELKNWTTPNLSKTWIEYINIEKQKKKTAKHDQTTADENLGLEKSM